MALSFITDIDLAGNELQNFGLQTLASDPTGFTGRAYFNTTDSKIRVYDGTAWAEVGVTYTADGTTLVLTGTEFSIAGGGVGTAQLAAAAVTAAKLSGTPGNGTSGQLLSSDGSGGFAWTTAVDEDVNTTNLTARLAQIDPTIGTGTGTVTINGNLTVSGTTTTLDTVTLEVTDNIVTLNAGATAPALDAGIEVNRGSAQFVPALKWNETTDRWQFSNDGTTYYDMPLPSQYSVGDITGVTAGDGITGGGTSGTVTVTNEYIREIVPATGAGAYFSHPIPSFVPESVECTVKEILVGGNLQMVVTDWTVNLGTGNLDVYLAAGVDYIVTIGGIRQ